jgi:NADPH:quinone reductase-like Zn-dependent oxidoreductase
MGTIPKTMRAAAIDRFGGPEVLTIHELPVPEIDSNEVLTATHTAGVGPWDADIRYPGGTSRFSLVLGTDGSGTVAAAGSRVRRLKVGDEVYSDSRDNPKGVSTPSTSPSSRRRSGTNPIGSTWSTPAPSRPPDLRRSRGSTVHCG